jgi:ABC-2 type transport system permease protein
VIGPIRAELLKFQRAWSTWIIGGILVAIELLLSYLLILLIIQSPVPPDDPAAAAAFDELRASMQPERAIPNALGMLAGLGGALALVLGAMSTAREFSGRTISILLTQRPTRPGLVVAKLIALGLVIAIYVAATFLAALAGSNLVAVLQGEEGGLFLDDLLGALGAGWLILAAWAGLGFALGFLLRSTGLSIGLGLVYALVVESLVGALGLASELFANASRVLLGANATALASSFGEAVAGGGFGGELPEIEPLTATAVLVAWLVVPIILATIVFIRRDVT